MEIKIKKLTIFLFFSISLYFLFFISPIHTTERNKENASSTSEFNFPIIMKYFNSTPSKEVNSMDKTHISNLQNSVLGYKRNTKNFKENDEEIEVGEADNTYAPSSIEEIYNLINNKENLIIVFHAHWWGHCKKFIPIFKEISKIDLLRNFHFIDIQCTGSNEGLCEQFYVKKYPTIKVFVGGKELPFEPPREKINLIEFLIKISDSRSIKIKNLNELTYFNENYGDISFMFFGEEEEKFEKCKEEILGNLELKPYLYFAELKEEKDDLSKLLGLNSTKEKGIIKIGNSIDINSSKEKSYTIHNYHSCNKAKEFIFNNEYPLFKNLSINYIKRLQKSKVKMIILLLNTNINENNELKTSSTTTPSNYGSNLNNLDSVKFLQEHYSKENSSSEIIYGYLNMKNEDDLKLFEYFNINEEDVPSIVLYNFDNKKHFVDNNKLKTINDFVSRVQELKELITQNKLNWFSGNFIEDLLFSLGYEITPASLMILVVLVMVLLFVLISLCSFFFESRRKNKIASSLKNTSTANANTGTNTIIKEEKSKANLENKKKLD